MYPQFCSWKSLSRCDGSLSIQFFFFVHFLSSQRLFYSLLYLLLFHFSTRGDNFKLSYSYYSLTSTESFFLIPSLSVFCSLFSSFFLSLLTHSVLLIMIMEVYTTTLTQIGALLSRSKSPAAAPHSVGEGAKHESIIFRIFTTNCLWRGKTVGQRRQPHLDDNKRASHGHRTRWHHFLLPSWPVHPRAPHNFRRRRRRTARLKKLRCKFQTHFFAAFRVRNPEKATKRDTRPHWRHFFTVFTGSPATQVQINFGPFSARVPTLVRPEWGKSEVNGRLWKIRRWRKSALRECVEGKQAGTEQARCSRYKLAGGKWFVRWWMGYFGVLKWKKE